MLKFEKSEKAGLYLTIIVHLGLLIVLLLFGIGGAIQTENSFVLDFSKYEELERLKEELAFKEAINQKLQAELASNTAPVRGVAVDRSALKDDRNTDAEQLYKDAERLQNELNKSFNPNSEDFAEPNIEKKEDTKKEEVKYSGPSVISYELEGRKASTLPIPAYRCMGAGEVTVIISVNPSGTVINAKIDESLSSSDKCLRSFATRAARLSKFSAKSDAPAVQKGNIVYSFVAQ